MSTFISKIQNLHFSLDIGSVRRHFDFKPKGAPYFHGYMYVSDKAEIAALKQHPMYGRVFYEDPDTAEPEPTPEREYASTYPDVTRTQEANAILAAEPYNIDRTTLKSKADALRIADELNIAFPNLK